MRWEKLNHSRDGWRLDVSVQRPVACPGNSSHYRNIDLHEFTHYSLSVSAHGIYSFEHRLVCCRLVRVDSGRVSSNTQILARNHVRGRCGRCFHGYLFLLLATVAAWVVLQSLSARRSAYLIVALLYLGPPVLLLLQT